MEHDEREKSRRRRYTYKDMLQAHSELRIVVEEQRTMLRRISWRLIVIFAAVLGLGVLIIALLK